MTLAWAHRLWPALLMLTAAAAARAQSIEPRAFAPAPVGVNFLVVGLAGTRGGLATDAALPLTDAKIETFGPVLAYARSLDLWGRSGKLDMELPSGRLSGSALFEGEPVSREVTGFGDPRARLSVILHGAPALTLPDFAQYRQGLLVGASVQIGAPLGQYDHQRLLNLSAHRWTVKPEIGVSQALGRLILEVSGAVTVFGANDDFFGGHRRTQSPLWAGQLHVVYNFRSGLWGSLDATWFTGAQTSVDGALQGGLERNWRLGGTLAIPAGRRNSLKLFASRGVSARTRNGFDLAGLAWQHRWGGGL